MTAPPTFQSASPYQDDVLALPVSDLDAASDWYCKHFGMTEIERLDSPNASVILERDGVQIGFSINGGDPSQEGAAIRVIDIDGIKVQLESELRWTDRCRNGPFDVLGELKFQWRHQHQ